MLCFDVKRVNEGESVEDAAYQCDWGETRPLAARINPMKIYSWTHIKCCRGVCLRPSRSFHAALRNL